jgi:hypothetical protein
MSLVSRGKQAIGTARELRRVHQAGGPKRLRLIKVEHPRGLIFASAQATLDVETNSGKTVRVSPALPVPFLYAWGWRLARRLKVPFISDVDPKDISASIRVPGWAWPGDGKPDGRGTKAKKAKKAKTGS